MTELSPAGRFTIGADHPALPGHFPGQPIVPGVVLLDEVLACLPEGARLITVKFTGPVGPQTEVEVQSGCDAAGRIAFACFAGGRRILQGTAAS